MGRIKDNVFVSAEKVRKKSLELECFMENGNIMEVTHSYGDSYSGKGFDFDLEKWLAYKTTEPFLKKYGVSELEFAYCIDKIMKEIYGNKGVRPFQEFKCKINDDTFTAFIILGKIKNKKATKDNDTIMYGIYEALDNEGRKLMDNLKESAMELEI